MTARVSLDFKNGVYSIGGVSKTAVECFVPGPVDVDQFSYGDIVTGVGLRVIHRDGELIEGPPTVFYKGNGSSPRLTPAALAAVLADGVIDGFTAVMTSIEYTSSGAETYAAAGCRIYDGEVAPGGFGQGWEFVCGWQRTDGNISSINTATSAFHAVPKAFMGRHKSAFLLSSTVLTASIDGLTESTVAPNEGTTGSVLALNVTAATTDPGDVAICILEKIEFFPADDSDLPGLSEPDSDGLMDFSVRIRSWGYSLDGHKKVIWRLGPTETLEFDLTTQTWAALESPGRDNWRAHCGQNWIGMSTDTLANGFGSDVVVGDDASGVLFILDPTYGRDDRSTTGDDSFNRVVTGGMVLSGREIAPCGALQLDYSAGNPSQSGATFTLETSDDWGRTFDDQGSVTVTADDFSGVVEWRGLGTARAPGRVFRITDNGAAIRLSGADLR